MKWKDLIELRYEVLSSMGVDALQEFIDIFRKNNGRPITETTSEGQTYEGTYGYHDAVVEYHDKNYPEWRDEK